VNYSAEPKRDGEVELWMTRFHDQRAWRRRMPYAVYGVFCIGCCHTVPLVASKLLLEMLSKVDSTTATTRDQGPGLTLTCVFLAACVFGTLQRKILY
jgi:hypothetical protein